MLSKPVLARCDNRSRQARKHPSSGDPEEWLADSYLSSYGLLGLSFDFFVHWKTGSIPNELWIKRIVNDSVTPWPMKHAGNVPAEIYQCDGEEKVRQLCRFANTHNFTCHYFLFKESLFFNRTEYSVEVRLNEKGDVVHIKKVKLSDLKDRIREIRGRPFSSKKTLVYGQTTLECYLSNNTSAIWPGDADLVLVDSNFTPRVIIEFKKETQGKPIYNETLSNYYPKDDPLKYDSFAYFRDHFTDDPSTLPIVVLYYSVMPTTHQVKLELIEGNAPRKLRSAKSKLLPLPNANNEASCKELIEALLGLSKKGEL